MSLKLSDTEKALLFLYTHGIGKIRALKIYKKYGHNTINVVKNDPYKLSTDILGIGFKIADNLATNLGVKKNSIKRIESGIKYILQKYVFEGHCAIEKMDLIKSVQKLLNIHEQFIITVIDNLVNNNQFILEKIYEKEYLFSYFLYQEELNIAIKIRKLQNGSPPWGNINYFNALKWVENINKINLSPSQKDAINIVLKEKVVILTGGPGVGKTTIVNSLLKIILAKKMKISLCAPTGRAAKRLRELTNYNAKTIHKLLEYDIQTKKFKYNQYNNLLTDLVIVDEISMVDISLWYNLIISIPIHASLLMIGDIDQLPSIGPGLILSDMIKSKVIKVIYLKEIFRQVFDSQIIINAHRINQGLFPDFNSRDFYFIKENNINDIQKKIISLAIHDIPQKFGFDTKRDIQILTPMNKGPIGSIILNNLLQSKLNISNYQLNKFGTFFVKGDKIVQNNNNYEKGVFNGDIGFITEINSKENVVFIDFNNLLVKYNFNELDEITLAYATSIHKSQGSEYPVVIIPIIIQHYMLLARNLLYTAITRGTKLVIIIGQKKALTIAIKNSSIQKRITSLQIRLHDCKEYDKNQGI